jgi:exodeoxyribonuclease VIII
MENEAELIGVHAGTPPEVYHNWPGAHYSTLKYMRQSAAHFYVHDTNPQEPTEAMNLGQALHTAVLEPEEFDERFAEAPSQTKRSAKERAAWAELQAERPKATILRPDAFERVAKISTRVHRHPTIGPMLKGGGLSELSMAWRDEASGLLCRGRIDWVGQLEGYNCFIDFKFVNSIEPQLFAKSVYEHGWYIQAPMYINGGDETAPTEEGRRFKFVAVETSPPYEMIVYELDDAAYLQGEAEYKRYLMMLAKCKESGKYPGKPLQTQVISLPGWARTEEGQ